jgi:hypothetical protein
MLKFVWRLLGIFSVSSKKLEDIEFQPVEIPDPVFALFETLTEYRVKKESRIKRILLQFQAEEEAALDRQNEAKFCRSRAAQLLAQEGNNVQVELNKREAERLISKAEQNERKSKNWIDPSSWMGSRLYQGNHLIPDFVIQLQREEAMKIAEKGIELLVTPAEPIQQTSTSGKNGGQTLYLYEGQFVVVFWKQAMEWRYTGKKVFVRTGQYSGEECSLYESTKPVGLREYLWASAQLTHMTEEELRLIMEYNS